MPKFKILNPATKLLTYLYGYGDDDANVDVDNDPDDLEDFFSRLADTSVEEESETDLEETDLDDDLEAIAGDDAEVDEPVVTDKPVVEEEPKVEEVKPVVEEQPKVTPEPVEVPKEKTPEEQEAENAQIFGELQKVYAISDEDADAILSDPKTAVPRLMANAHAIMMQTAYNMIQQFVPQIIEAQKAQSTTRQTLIEKFSTKWPDLAGEDTKQAVIAAIGTVRQLNPNIDVDTLIAKVGPVAYSILGKTPAPAKQTPPAAKPPRPRPHTPARSRETSPAKPAQTGDAVADFIGSLLNSKE